MSLNQPVIRRSDLPVSILRWFDQISGSSEGSEKLEEQPIDSSQLTIEQALEKCGNNKSKAAKLLGVSRMTLWRQLKNK